MWSVSFASVSAREYEYENSDTSELALLGADDASEDDMVCTCCCLRIAFVPDIVDEMACGGLLCNGGWPGVWLLDERASSSSVADDNADTSSSKLSAPGVASPDNDPLLDL